MYSGSVLLDSSAPVFAGVLAESSLHHNHVCSKRLRLLLKSWERKNHAASAWHAALHSEYTNLVTGPPGAAEKSQSQSVELNAPWGRATFV